MNLVADVLSRKIQSDMLAFLSISKVYEELSISGWRFQPGDQYFFVSFFQVESQIVMNIREAQRTDSYIYDLRIKA